MRAYINNTQLPSETKKEFLVILLAENKIKATYGIN